MALERVVAGFGIPADEERGHFEGRAFADFQGLDDGIRGAGFLFYGEDARSFAGHFRTEVPAELVARGGEVQDTDDAGLVYP